MTILNDSLFTCVQLLLVLLGPATYPRRRIRSDPTLRSDSRCAPCTACVSARRTSSGRWSSCRPDRRGERVVETRRVRVSECTKVIKGLINQEYARVEIECECTAEMTIVSSEARDETREEGDKGRK
jgi:hypothetical protein